jgi:hypothetical protein
MIIKSMAITRCPYCHAITDENDKYCNNCGTQLLFPEDDEVDEEIPGEKIIDAEVEEKDYTVNEPENEKRPPSAKDAEEDIDEKLEEEMREKDAEKALDELVVEEELEEEAEGATEEVILVDEIEASETADRSGTGEIEEKTGPVRKDKAAGEADEEAKEKIELEDEKDGEAEIDEEDVEKKTDTGALAGQEETAEPIKPAEGPAPSAGEEPEVEYLTGPSGEAEADDISAATAGESALRPVTFDTRELESLGRTVDLSKEKIDKFIQVMAEKKPAETPAPAPSPAPAGTRDPTGSLPPWASTMKGAPVFPPDTAPIEPKKGPMATPSTEDEVEIFPRRKPSDSTLGLPERVSQAPLPFGQEAGEDEAGAAEEAGAGGEADEEAEDGTGEAVRPPAGPERAVRPPVLPVRGPGRVEAAVIEDAEEPRERPPFSFSVFFKSKAFDILFVGVFWLVALWLAAHALGQTLFEILAAVSGPMLLLYAVFVLLYFFLFKFFLGETLGDRLFRRRD